jgi:protein-L-isoaspartate(D-aspartate) O-methyltransferase
MKAPYRLEVDQMAVVQLEKRSILDLRGFAAFRKLPRHEFIPDNLRGQAYADGPLPLMEGQPISPPSGRRQRPSWPRRTPLSGSDQLALGG